MWKCSRAQNILFKNLQCQILHLGKTGAPSSEGASLNEAVWQSLLKGENNQQPGWTRGKPSVRLGFNYRKVNHTDCCCPCLELRTEQHTKVSNPPKQGLFGLHTNLLRHTYKAITILEKWCYSRKEKKKNQQNNWGQILAFSHSYYFYSWAEIQVKSNSLVASSK